jgi:mitogen-activated protein kinase kinase
VQSDSSSSSSRKKIATTGKSKKHKDKNGEELVKDEDLEVLMDLGAGNGGTVTKVWNKKRKCVMARKVSSGRATSFCPRT